MVITLLIIIEIYLFLLSFKFSYTIICEYVAGHILLFILLQLPCFSTIFFILGLLPFLYFNLSILEIGIAFLQAMFLQYYFVFIK